MSRVQRKELRQRRFLHSLIPLGLLRTQQKKKKSQLTEVEEAVVHGVPEAAAEEAPSEATNGAPAGEKKKKKKRTAEVGIRRAVRCRDALVCDDTQSPGGRRFLLPAHKRG